VLISLMLLATAFLVFGRKHGARDLSAKRDQAALIARIKGANAHVRKLVCIVYTVSGKGDRITGAEREVRNNGVGAYSVKVALDPARAENHRLLDEKMARKVPWMKEMARWEIWHDIESEAAATGGMYEEGDFIVFRLRFPPGQLDSESVAVSKGFYRSTCRLAWRTGEGPGGFWSLLFWRYLREGDGRLRVMGTTSGPEQRVQFVKSVKDVGTYVREWILESPNLVVAAPHLRKLLDAERNPSSAGTKGVTR